MKKLSLILLGTLAVIPAVEASLFNGFYLGGQLGGTQRSDKTSTPSVDFTPITATRFQQAAINKTNKGNGLTYGIYTGYGQSSNGFYWGAELSLEGDTASKTNTTKPAITITPTLPASGTLTTKYERGMVFGITPRMGVVIGNDNLLYLKLGVEYSRDKLKGRYEGQTTGYTVSKSFTKTKSQFAFVPGIGFEKAFGKVLARVEYGYTFGGKITSKDIITGVSGKTTVKSTAHTAKLGIAYKF